MRVLGDSLVVATTAESVARVRESLSHMLGIEIRLVMADERQIRAAIARYYSPTTAAG
ncbi:MAG: hypothetical protein ACREJC_18950 [Tepidisphaeraceae bacterium]